MKKLVMTCLVVLFAVFTLFAESGVWAIEKDIDGVQHIISSGLGRYDDIFDNNKELIWTVDCWRRNSPVYTTITLRNSKGTNLLKRYIYTDEYGTGILIEVCDDDGTFLKYSYKQLGPEVDAGHLPHLLLHHDTVKIGLETYNPCYAKYYFYVERGNLVELLEELGWLNKL